MYLYISNIYIYIHTYIHVYNGCVYIYIHIHRILINCILITSSAGFSFRNSATTREKKLSGGAEGSHQRRETLLKCLGLLHFAGPYVRNCDILWQSNVVKRGIHKLRVLMGKSFTLW